MVIPSSVNPSGRSHNMCVSKEETVWPDVHWQGLLVKLGQIVGWMGMDGANKHGGCASQGLN